MMMPCCNCGSYSGGQPLLHGANENSEETLTRKRNRTRKGDVDLLFVNVINIIVRRYILFTVICNYICHIQSSCMFIYVLEVLMALTLAPLPSFEHLASHTSHDRIDPQKAVQISVNFKSDRRAMSC